MKKRSKAERMQRLRGFLFPTAIFAVIVIYWTGLYFGTAWLYGYLGTQPRELFRQLINSIGGMVLWGFTMLLISRYFHSQQMQFFQAMIGAIRRISKGDFNVSIEQDPNDGRFVEFVELVDSINDMAVELGQMEQMRQEFISNVSHEIQSPLTSISGFSRALQSGDTTPEERRHYLEIIEAESRRLSKLSDNLMKLTSLESQHHPFEPKSFRLDKQLRSVILACEPQWQEKEIELDIELATGHITADEELLSQAWSNLVYNAIKFTPVGGTIGIRLEYRDDRALVRISDTGIGIAEEDQAHIFERFYKADKSRNRVAGGSGLGLSIVKKIIDMHHGSIAVASKLGEGAEFTITLPLTK